jgi:hypothetical protein
MREVATQAERAAAASEGIGGGGGHSFGRGLRHFAHGAGILAAGAEAAGLIGEDSAPWAKGLEKGALGAAVGSEFGPVGAVVGGVAGGIAGYVQASQKEAADELKAAAKEQREAAKETREASKEQREAFRWATRDPISYGLNR